MPSAKWRRLSKRGRHSIPNGTRRTAEVKTQSFLSARRARIPLSMPYKQFPSYRNLTYNTEASDLKAH